MLPSTDSPVVYQSLTGPRRIPCACPFEHFNLNFYLYPILYGRKEKHRIFNSINSMQLRRIVVLAVLILSACLWAPKGKAQASWEPFGQNRVQYRTYDWQYYDSTHFRVFYYGSGKAHAIYSIGVAELELQHIVDLMGGRLNKKLNIIIYNNFSEYKQTNLGRKNEDLNDANGGMVDILGDNIPVYFNGDHLQLKKQIIKGITSILKDELMFGVSFKEILKSSVQMNLPEWFTKGYIAFISDEWTVTLEDELRNMILSSPNRKFEDYAMSKPLLCGHSFWNFLEEEYGEGTVSNLIYVTHTRRNINKAIDLVLRKSYKDVFKDWKNFYFKQDSVAGNPDSLSSRALVSRFKEKKGSSYSQFCMSPTGREIGYVEKRDGQFYIYMHDIKYHKTYKIMEGGIRAWSEMADPDYPLLCWSASGKKMAILYTRSNKLFLRTYTSGQSRTTNKQILNNRMERITGMSFTPEETALAITGIKKGQSDLFYLALRNNRPEDITKDLYDDKEPILNAQGIHNGILFLSNRNTPYIGENAKSDDFNEHFNLFLYRPSKGTNLLQLTKTDKPIMNAIPWGEEHFSFIQVEHGKQVRKLVKVVQRQEGDTIAVQNAAPLPFTVLKQEFIQAANKVVEVVRSKNELLIFFTPFDSLDKQDKAFAAQDVAADKVEENHVVIKDSIPEYKTAFDDQTSSLTLSNIFLSRVVNSNRLLMYTANNNNTKPKNYRYNFYPDFLQTTLDNTLLFTRYQPYEGNQGTFVNPPLSAFLTSSLTDVMEDYKFLGGARMGSNFSSYDYFVEFHNYRRRMDWGFLYYHNRTRREIDLTDIVPPGAPTTSPAFTTIDYFQGNAMYPIDIMTSLRLQVGVRRDGINIPAVNQYTLQLDNLKDFWNINRLELVYDNTTTPLQNIWKGTRAKAFVEYIQKLNNGNFSMYNFGFDGRNYLGLYKNVILASRLAGAFSGGNAKMLYLLGGVDNDISPKSDQNSIVDPSVNYAFQSLATNLRGYRQGFRKGNSYFIWNEEIRIPIMNTISKRYVRSGFIRSVQAVLFADLGSSWNGLLPNDKNLRLPSVVQGNQVNVYIDNNRYDFGMGYGVGLRTKLLGYFLRTDVAWNIEGQRKPILHVSMATDF